jgi:hypothetical protein
MSESRIVEAVGVVHLTGGQVSRMLQVAMVAAVEDAQREGVTDPNEIRARMLAARHADGHER